jgi:hypothetical protein
MEKKQWQELCQQIAALWPGKRVPDATVDAWYREFASWANYEVLGKAITGLAAKSDRAPTLAGLREAYAGRGGETKRLAPEEPPDPETRAHWDALGKDWTRINECMWDEGVSAVYHALMDADVPPADVKLALLDEIEARNIERKPWGGVGARA